MRPVEARIEDVNIPQEHNPPELLNELFWAAMARGLASGTGAWGRLFCDVRGWTKGGGDTAERAEERISDAEAAALVRAVLGADE